MAIKDDNMKQCISCIGQRIFIFHDNASFASVKGRRVDSSALVIAPVNGSCDPVDGEAFDGIGARFQNDARVGAVVVGAEDGFAAATSPEDQVIDAVHVDRAARVK